MDAPITYEEKFLSDPDCAFKELMEEVLWESRTPARSECWMNPLGTPYTYGQGEGERTYEAREVHPVVGGIFWRLFEEYDIKLDACFLNRYDDQRQALGWHADDSPEIDDTRAIAVVSLGAERDIMFRRKDKSELEKLRLAHGSLLIMHPGMQRTHDHKIPKHDQPCIPRISLTYRGLTGV